MAVGEGLVRVELGDGFWAPRQEQVRTTTLPVLLERLEAHGVVDNFRRVRRADIGGRRGLWFTDSDLYKWMEAAAWAGRLDLLGPVIEAVLAAQHDDGYLHTYYGQDAGGPPRYSDLAHGHEWYCFGHFIEAALAHRAVTGSDEMLGAAQRLADHLLTTCGPAAGGDRVDGHPEIEVATARLAAATGDERYLAFARWAVETQLANAGLSIASVDLAGHAVRALYLASGIAEVALATGDGEWVEAAERLFATMVEQRSYPTGGVGGRWQGEAVGRPYELSDETSYAESCAAVAATQFSARVWRLNGDPRALDQVETLLFNAVPCGTGADGSSWFYSQPHAVAPDAFESNPWVQPFDYQDRMLLEWFPPRRHDWFEVTCCPPNLSRLVASVDRYVAELDRRGHLRLHLPLAGRITGGGWDVTVESDYPDGGDVRVEVTSAPAGGEVMIRIPGWCGGSGHEPLGDDPGRRLPVEPVWWETDPRVEGLGGDLFLRRGPVVHCVEGIDVEGVDLRYLTVDPTAAPPDWFARHDHGSGSGPTSAGRAPLYRPVGTSWPVAEEVDGSTGAADRPAVVVAVPTVPYHEWCNRGPTSMRLRFPRRPAVGGRVTDLLTRRGDPAAAVRD